MSAPDYILPSESLNQPMLNGLRLLLARVPHAHYIDVVVRINGNDEKHQADWIKHLAQVQPTTDGQTHSCPLCDQRAEAETAFRPCRKQTEANHDRRARKV